MRVSAKSDYALRALIELAGREDGAPVSAEELGRLQDIPHGFLQAILADLRRAGVVMSQRGQSGGWRMARDPAEVGHVPDPVRGRLAAALSHGSLWDVGWGFGWDCGGDFGWGALTVMARGRTPRP